MSLRQIQIKNKNATKNAYFNISQSSADTYLLFSSHTKIKSQQNGFLIVSILPAAWFENLKAFYQIWPLNQWITSLVSLILLYWITGYYYNKWLSDRGGWLNFKTRVWLIISDLVINLALGLYYMHHRNTLLGAIMLKCPIAISPAIFLLEMVCVYVYYRYWKKK